jgi:hypothetical protein
VPFRFTPAIVNLASCSLCNRLVRASGSVQPIFSHRSGPSILSIPGHPFAAPLPKNAPRCVKMIETLARASDPHPEACVRLRQDEVQRHRQEP